MDESLYFALALDRFVHGLLCAVDEKFHSVHDLYPRLDETRHLMNDMHNFVNDVELFVELILHFVQFLRRSMNRFAFQVWHPVCPLHLRHQPVGLCAHSRKRSHPAPDPIRFRDEIASMGPAVGQPAPWHRLHRTEARPLFSTP
jgi:hypothetical protein